MTRRDHLLLKEYEVCQQTANQVGARAWQLTAVLAALGLGGVWVVLQSGVHGPAVVMISLAGIFLTWMWMTLVNRHVRQQRVFFHRLREIEETLELRAGRYVYLVDGLRRNGNVLKQEAEDEKAGALWISLGDMDRDRLLSLWRRLEAMRQNFLAFPGFEGQRAMKLMGYLAIASWTGLSLGEALYVLVGVKGLSQFWGHFGGWLGLVAPVLPVVFLIWASRRG